MGLSESRPEPLARLFIPWRCWLSCLSHSAGLPRFLDRSIHARCPQPPRKAQRVHAYWFPVDDRLHPSRRTGHFQIPNEAESGSLALRLTCLPIPRLHQMDCSHLALAGLHVRTGNLHGEHLSSSQDQPGLSWRTDRKGAFSHGNTKSILRQSFCAAAHLLVQSGA